MDETKQILQMLGKIDGKLEGLERTIDLNQQNINQRLDDLQKSNDQRFDSIEKRVEHVEEEQKNMIWKVAGWSGLTGAIVTGAVELMKQFK